MNSSAEFFLLRRAADPMPTAGSEASVDALMRCIDRIESLIDTENHSLRSLVPLDLEASNLRKARALIELARVSQSLTVHPSSEAASRLVIFREKLAENGELLEHHLRATIEIAELLVATIRRERSDGTYSNKPAVVKG